MSHGSKIDWDAPLEAYHPDGRIVEVELDFECSDLDDEELSLVDGIEGRWYFFSQNGKGSHNENPWQIRNRPQPAPQYPVELVERMVEYIRNAAYCDRNAAAIMAELEPADPDLELAREVAADAYDVIFKANVKAGIFPSGTTYPRDAYFSGKADDMPLVQTILAAIKRVRAEKGW